MAATLRLVQAVDDLPMEIFDGYEFWLRAKGCGDSTVYDRITHLAKFARDVPNFPGVSPREISAWLGRPGFAPWTRASYYGHLRSWFRFALEFELVSDDPMAKMRRPKPPKSAPRPLTPAQVVVVLAAANPNTHAWLTLGLFAGLRAHEIAKVRGEDVQEDQLYVLGKGGHGEYVATHQAIWRLAQSRPRHGWWFPTTRSSVGHVTSGGVSTMTSRLFAAHHIEGSVHRCRHTFATELLRAGVNIRVVQTLMRHECLSSTQIYTAVDEIECRDAINLLRAA